MRRKEWDYFFIRGGTFGLALTLADNAYLGLASITFFDFSLKAYTTKTRLFPWTMGKMGLPETSKEGSISFRKKGLSFAYTYEKDKKHLQVEYDNFSAKMPLQADITLYDVPGDSLVITIPFRKKPRHFYYNEKVLAMKAKGKIKVEGKTYTLPEESLGILDWGRGVWPYRVKWYWGAAQGYVGDKRFALNIGTGFGDTSKATEDMLFVDGKAHKLGNVTWQVSLDDQGKPRHMEPWSFHSDDDRLQMDFTPLVDRHDHTSLGIIMTDQHQVFGHFRGKARLDDGEEVSFRDLFGFAEIVKNRW